jgi:hypothetical protein
MENRWTNILTQCSEEELEEAERESIHDLFTKFDYSHPELKYQVAPAVFTMPTGAAQEAEDEEEDEDDAASSRMTSSRNKKQAPAGGTGRSCGKGYTDTELFCMAQAWVQVSEDPRVGSCQKKEAFDQKVFQCYVNLIEHHNDDIRERWNGNGPCPKENFFLHRERKNIVNRLDTLKKTCSQFKAIVKQYPQASGENDDSTLARRLEMYEMQYKEAFKYIEPYGVLSASHKWNILDEEVDKSGGKKKRKLTAAERDAARAAKEQNKRPIGKGRKSIADKVASACVDLGVGRVGNSLDDDCFGAMTRSICGLTDSLAVQTWEEVDRIQYLKSEATLKRLEKEKQILLAETELLELRKKHAKLQNSTRSGARQEMDSSAIGSKSSQRSAQSVETTKDSANENSSDTD